VNKRIWFFLLNISTLCFVSGCSFQYIDKYGAKHVVGLSHVVTKELGTKQEIVLIQQVTSIGVALLKVPEQQGVSVGYTRNFSVNVYDKEMAGLMKIELDDPANIQYQGLSEIKEEEL